MTARLPHSIKPPNTYLNTVGLILLDLSFVEHITLGALAEDRDILGLFQVNLVLVFLESCRSSYCRHYFV